MRVCTKCNLLAKGKLERPGTLGLGGNGDKNEPMAAS